MAQFRVRSWNGYNHVFHETIEADGYYVDGGRLVFEEAGGLAIMFAAGAWFSVEQL